VNIAAGAAQGIAKIAGSTGYNAGAHFNQNAATTGSLAMGLGAAVGGSMMHLGKSVSGSVSDHFRHISSKLSGGPGSQQPISSVSERMHQFTQDIKSRPKP
jgi:hypothetical protein